MKTRRTFLGKTISWMMAAAGLTIAAAPANASGRRPEKIKGNFLHVVYFWLKHPEDPAERKKFEKELLAFINNVPGIQSKHVGTPADTNRPVIDNTYTYSLVLSFDTRRTHDIYQDHPLHKIFIENAGALWKKVLVYDSIHM